MDFLPVPNKHISPRVKMVWRISDAVTALGLMLGASAIYWAFAEYLWLQRIVLLAGGLLVFLTITNLCFQGMQQRVWRYEAREKELETLEGVLFKRRALIPLSAIQFVDTTQGPLERMFNVMTVRLSTAAKSHRIPGLDPETAVELRGTIMAQAGIADE